MAKYTAIADIGKTIVEMLRDNLVPEPVAKPESIGICDPKERGNFIVGIHPYNIVENKEIVTKPINLPDGCIQDPPTSYQIYYVLSIASKAELSNRSSDEQRILGRVLQIFKDSRILKKKYMPDALKLSNESISLDVLTLELEEKVKIWGMFSEAYKLSIFFSLGPVLIESTNIRVPARRVTTFEVKDDQKK